MTNLNSNETQLYCTLLRLIRQLPVGTQFAVRNLMPCTPSRISIKLLRDIETGKVTMIRKYRKTSASWDYERV